MATRPRRATAPADCQPPRPVVISLLLKLALIIFRSDPDHGGAERYTVDLAAALAARGHAVDLLSSRFGPAIPGVDFIELPTNGVTRLRKYQSFLRALEIRLSEQKYDITHAMLPVPSCDVYHPHAGLAAESMRRISSKWSPKRRSFAAVEAALLASNPPPIVLCLSDYVKRAMLAHYPQLQPSLVKLFNAVDLHHFDPQQNPTARAELRKRFAIADTEVAGLMIAQDFQRKGLPQTLSALAELKSEKLKLMVVGREEPRDYERMARRLGITDKIIFAGSTHRPEDFYLAADFFVLPTRHDPCSLVVLESLAMGLPVISTIFNGACEIMETGRQGIVLQSPDDVPALANAMRQMLDSQFRETARRECLALRPQLSYPNHVQLLEKIYESRLAQKSAARDREN